MSIENFNRPVADNVSRIINEKGLKQCAVAKKAGYTTQMLNDMVNGRKLMKSADIVRLKNALEVSYNELYKEVKESDA